MRVLGGTCILPVRPHAIIRGLATTERAPTVIETAPQAPLHPAPPGELRSYRRIEILAWAIITTSFLVFAGLVVLLWKGVPAYLSRATLEHEARVEVFAGTVEVQEPGSTRWEVIGPNRVLREGDTLHATDNAKALVTFFDSSTVRLYPTASITLEKMRSSRFGKRFTYIRLAQQSGRVRVGVAHLDASASIQFLVYGGGGRAIFWEEGSYSTEVMRDGTFSVTARMGRGDVIADGQLVGIGGGERAAVVEGRPVGPEPAAQDLVANGSFSALGTNGLPRGWLVFDRNEGKESVVGSVSIQRDGDVNRAVFGRRGGTYHGEDGLHQEINADVSDFDSLILSADVRIDYQKLPGGGFVGSEYPLILRVTYLDSTNAQWEWYHGFYIQNELGYPAQTGEQIAPGEFRQYSQNLFSTGYPRPARILSMDVFASGWDYESQVKNVRLVGE